MLFFDAHCHLHDSRIRSDLPAIVRRAGMAGVTHMATCATMEENFGRTARLADQYKAILPFFGIHPWFIHTISSQWRNTLKTRLLASSSGVGEIGLDFTDKNADREKQTAVFEYQLALARDLGRVANIHVRKAWDAMIHIFKRFGRFETPVVIHSYSGSAEMIRAFEKFNVYFSFSGSITHPGSLKGVKNLMAVDRGRFVLETDTPDILPYLPGQARQGLNEPANLPGIVKIAADRLETDASALARQAYENSLTLFSSLIQTADPDDRHTAIPDKGEGSDESV